MLAKPHFSKESVRRLNPQLFVIGGVMRSVWHHFVRLLCANRSLQIKIDVEGTDEVGIYMFLAHTMLDNESQRGEHDIEHEISFKSNDRFVFHDSRGFEAGSTDELHKVQAFIEERANEQALEARLHAIWFKSMWCWC